MDESFTNEYLFHYTSIENMNSINVGGCINAYQFLNHGKGVFFHKIQPQNHDDSIIRVIYGDKTKTMNKDDKEKLKKKVRCAFAFKLDKKLMANRVSDKFDLFKRNAPLCLNDFDPFFVIIRKSGKNK